MTARPRSHRVFSESSIGSDLGGYPSADRSQIHLWSPPVVIT
ncbi:hypothetical protein [Dietzia cercidiphylli]